MRTIDRRLTGEGWAPNDRRTAWPAACAPHAYRRLRRNAVRAVISMAFVVLLLILPILSENGAFASGFDRAAGLGVWTTSSS